MLADNICVNFDKLLRRFNDKRQASVVDVTFVVTVGNVFFADIARGPSCMCISVLNSKEITNVDIFP